MDNDSLKCLYQDHGELLRHYSSKIFLARMSILTAGAGLAGLVLGIHKLNMESVSSLGGLTPKQFVTLIAPALIATLWTMENGYFKKYNIVVLVLRDLEKAWAQSSNNTPKLFFSRYRPFTHIAFYFSYVFMLFAFVLWACAGGILITNGWTLLLAWGFAAIMTLAAIIQLRNIAVLWIDAGFKSELPWLIRIFTFV